MSGLEFFVEFVRRAFNKLNARKLEDELPAGWNKGSVVVNLVFEDGELKNVEVW